MELYSVGIFRIFHRFQEDFLGLFVGEAARAKDHHRILLRLCRDDRASLDADAVGHHYKTGLVAAVGEVDTDRFGGTMYVRAVVVNSNLPEPGDECIEQFCLSQSYIRKDVLGKHMEGTDAGDSLPLCDPDRGGFQRKGFGNVYHVRPGDSLCYHFPVYFGEIEAVGVDDRLEDGDLEVFQRVIGLFSLRIRIAAGHKSYVDACTFQTAEQGEDGGADAVTTKVGVVANYQDFHCCLFGGAMQIGYRFIRSPVKPGMTKA